MKRFPSWREAAAAIALMALAGAPVAGQATTGKAAGKGTAGVKTGEFRTPWGDPDLQGVWNGSTVTPLERPKQFANKAVLTEEEQAKVEKEDRARQVDRPPRAGDPGTYNQFWFDPASKGLPDRRTSLIVDPPDGQIPYTPDGAKMQTRSRQLYGQGRRDSWLDLDTGERCVTDGPPIYFSGYLNNYQITQSPGFVIVLHELYRENRIIPLDGTPGPAIPSLTGNPRGHWEGDTLVVESKNFRDVPGRWSSAWRSVRPSTRIVERFTRVDAHTIDYKFTWEDPVLYTRPWTAAYPLTNDQASRGLAAGQIYEYACHEGNYAAVNMLNGARVGEKKESTGSK